MKHSIPALLLLSVFALSACGKEEDGAAKTDGAADSASASSYDSASEPASDAPVVAVVNGVELTEARVSVYLKGLPPLHEGGRGEVIENMVSSELLAQAAEKGGLLDELREDIRVAGQAVLVRTYLNQYLADNPVSEEVLKARYDEFAREFQGQQEYLASHILVAEEAAAKAALAEVQGNPERFAEVAKEISTDKGSGANGGDLGWTSPGNLVAPFAEAMQQMKPGEMSAAPVQTQFGWHIIYLREVRGASPPPLEGRFRQQLENEARNDSVRRHIEQLRAAAQVELKEAP